MYKKYPYWGLLALTIILWSLVAFIYNSHRLQLLPERMVHAVNKDLKNRTSDYNRFINDSLLIRKIISDSLTEKEAFSVITLPFFVYVYAGDTLQYWNTNRVIGTCPDSATVGPMMVINEKGVFVERCSYFDYQGMMRKIVVLFPVCILYPLENEYLKSHYLAYEQIPINTRISTDSLKGGYPVMMNGKNVFYMHFNEHDIQKWTPDANFLILLFFAFLTLIIWVQLMVLYYTRTHTRTLGFALTLSIIVLVKLWFYFFGLPFNLESLPFFEPQTLSRVWYARSIGDLYINMLLFLWFVVFMARETDFFQFHIKLPKKWMEKFAVFVLMVLIHGLAYVFSRIFKDLITNPNISFDVSHFSTISIFTILGLVIVGLLTGILCMFIYVFGLKFSKVITNKPLKYLMVFAAGFCWLEIVCKWDDPFCWALVAWLTLYIAFMDIPNLRIVSDLLEPHMVFWAVFVCLFSTGVVHFFNQQKEKNQRKIFVEQRLSPHRDTLMENAFARTAERIKSDKMLQSFLDAPSSAGRKALNQHFETQYFNDAFNQYQEILYVFDSKGEALYNKDTTDFSNLVREKDESSATGSENLFYKESILNRHYYLSYIPVYADSSVNLLGFVMIDLALKKQQTDRVYPELLQPRSARADEPDNEYAYAVYVNDKLITQTKVYPFLLSLTDDTLRNQEYAFYEKKNITELHYKISDKRTVVVVHNHSELIETVTLFSYLFVIQVAIAILAIFYRLLLSIFTGVLDLRIRLSLRGRIHFSMLTVIMVSFIVVGSVTIVFFGNEYAEFSSNKLQSVMQVVKQSVQDYLKRENAFETDQLFDSVGKSNRFKYFISGLANDQKIDISVYDDHGSLFSTSQDEIFEKGLLSRKIRPDAFFLLRNEAKSILIQNEKIAGLSYQSVYQPLRDEQGVILGYINVPFFSSQKDVNYQVSNILVTLINLYAFIFLLSSFFTVFITKWMVRNLNLIARQFKQLRLQKNERLKWPYEDEIGTLVTEYNKMIEAVEENALLLARSERESAWREMAKQIAHEIKNPLTPMKLNIQYLQQAIHNNHPNIRQLADRLTQSIVEQIDNLSYIASEFSNFAKMPDANPDEIELNELLMTAADLYRSTPMLNLYMAPYDGRIFVYSDKNQLLRVFTNLMENAKQAIPEGRHGYVEVRIKPDGGDVIVSIADNGTGIAPETAGHIFQPYFTTKSSGTGLGLAITLKIIEFWQGDIWFESQPGEGTVFYVKLKVTRLEG